MTWFLVGSLLLLAFSICAAVLVVKWGRESVRNWSAAAEHWKAAAAKWAVAEENWKRAEESWRRTAEIHERRRRRG